MIIVPPSLRYYVQHARQYMLKEYNYPYLLYLGT